MVADDGVTVIDFGTAAKLAENGYAHRGYTKYLDFFTIQAYFLKYAKSSHMETETIEFYKNALYESYKQHRQIMGCVGKSRAQLTSQMLFYTLITAHEPKLASWVLKDYFAYNKLNCLRPNAKL